MSSHTITGIFPAGYNVTVATLLNQGTINGPLPGNGIRLYSANSADIINSGTIAPGSLHPAVSLHAGGTLTNPSGGTIGGTLGVSISQGAGTVINAGTTASDVYGVNLGFGGSVTNAASDVITGVTDGVFGFVGIAVNYGSISGTGSVSGRGVDLWYRGSVTNGVSGVITGVFAGVRTGAGYSGSSGPGTVVNAGSIAGSALYGVALHTGGSVTNAASASITGGVAGIILTRGGRVTNAGTITGGTDGVTLRAGGTLTNAGTIIGGVYGGLLTGGGTVMNAGTIVGNGGTAVSFGSGGPGLLVLDHGFAFTGDVVGSASVSDTLELASAASAGVLKGLGTEFVNFGSIVLDAGARWAVAGTVTTGQIVDFAGTYDLLTLSNPDSMSGTIDGFNDGDTIALAGIANVTSASIDMNNLLTVTRSVGASITLQFDPSHDFSAETFHYAVSGSATDITIMPRSALHWVGGSGNFNTTTDWTPQGVPGATDIAIIDAPGTYTVTATTNETVSTLAVAANAKLVVSAGTFTVGNGSGTGGLAGNIVVHAGAALALAGSVTNGGTIAGAGQLGGGAGLSLANAAVAVINANQAAALVLNTTGTVSNAGLIEATNTAVGNGGLVVQSTTIDNAGGTVAANGARTHVDLADVTLIGGVLATSGGGVIQTAAGANGVLDGLHDGALTNNGLVRVTDSTSLKLLGSIVNTGTLNVAGTTAGNTDLQIGSPVVTLTGGGTVLLSSNAGNRIIGTAAANQLVNSDNTIAGGGQLGAGALLFTNGGTVNANAAVGLIIDLGGQAGKNLAGGLIEATAAGGLTIASGTISNTGTMLAANGSKLTFQSGVTELDNKGGVLSWGTFKWINGLVVGAGTWEASGTGSALSVTGGAVTMDRAGIILSAPGSVFRAGDGSTFTNLEASLSGVAPIGVLDLLAGRSFIGTHGIADFGMIQLEGGTLKLPRLAVGASGHVRGFGTIADTRLPVFNGGTIEAQGGTLAVATPIDPASSGVFRLDASSVLEIAADQGAGGRMSFLGTGGELVIDAAEKFGLNVGGSAYTGPLVQNFGTGDAILLKNVAPAGLTPVYDTPTGILQLSNGSANVASLMFDNTTLGAGSFHLGDDGHGRALLTHS